MSEITSAPKMSTQRKSELFEKMMLTLTDFIPTEEALKFIGGNGDADNLVNSDFSATLNPIFKLMSDEELIEALKGILSKMLESDLGAKKVTIEW